MCDTGFHCSQTHRPESNLTGPFGSTSVCAPRTMPTLTVMKWTFIYLRLKKPKPRPLSWWGYVSSQHVVHSEHTHTTVMMSALKTYFVFYCVVLSVENWLHIDTNYNLSSRQKPISSLQETANLWLLLFRTFWQVSQHSLYIWCEAPGASSHSDKRKTITDGRGKCPLSYFS